MSSPAPLCPGLNCPICPRLVAYRQKNRAAYPNRHNAPVPPFGTLDSALLIVGLAPGLQGANFTGRPFTGDWAGDLLYATLIDYGWAHGVYQERADDGLTLMNCRITNAVKCVPPENKPTGDEISNCLPFLKNEIAAMNNLKVILSLGLVSHNAVLKALGQKASAYKFAHGAMHHIGDVLLIDSYHCSRYNTNTGRLTERMFRDVFDHIQTYLT
ncbi:MAG: uracil-DNA glycosylase [Alphaproteobacteria bacterium]|nr:uracil-DNA glycosylase [Alphaproteobacteria bacterium]